MPDMRKYGTCRFALETQAPFECRYDRLYLSEVSCIHVCNLSENISDNARVLSIQIPQDQRKEFYLNALWQESQDRIRSCCSKSMHKDISSGTHQS